jgi:hypothetical protein
MVRKAGALLLIAGLVVGFSTIAWAHSGYEYFVPEIPAGQEPVIDGVINDAIWVNMPSQYTFTTPDLFDPPWGGAGNRGLDDLDVKYWMAWSGDKNLFYAAVQMFDDVHVGDPAIPYWDHDSVNFYTDPDHSGGSFGWDEPEATRWSGGAQWWIDVDEASADWGPWGSMNTEKAYTEREDLWKVGWTKSGDGKTHYYEWYAALWDFQANLAQGGINAAKRHTLKAGETIHITLSVYDIDPGETPSEASITPIPNTCKIADGMSDLILAGPVPTAVESNTWGRIKSTFTK